MEDARQFISKIGVDEKWIVLCDTKSLSVWPVSSIIRSVNISDTMFEITTENCVYSANFKNIKECCQDDMGDSIEFDNGEILYFERIG